MRRQITDWLSISDTGPRFTGWLVVYRHVYHFRVAPDLTQIEVRDGDFVHRAAGMRPIENPSDDDLVDFMRRQTGRIATLRVAHEHPQSARLGLPAWVMRS